MSTASVPNTFSAAATIIASQHNANFAALVNLLNGSIDQTNFGTLTGLVTWSVTSNVLSLTSGNSGTEGSAKFSHTGVLASSKSVVWITSSAAQTTGDALLFLEATSSSTSIPALKISYSGAAASALALQVVSTTAPALPVPKMTTAQKAALSSAVAGSMVYDTTLDRLESRTTSQWRRVGDNLNVVFKSANYTAVASDDVIICDASGGAWTLTLPAGSTVSGKVLTIKRADDTPANALTIDADASTTIDGATTYKLYTKYESVSIYCDGTNWHVIDHTSTSDWSSSLTFTPNASGFDSVANAAFFARRVGDSLEVTGYFQFGTANASNAYIALPSGYTVDTAKIPATTKSKVGQWDGLNNAATTFGSNNLTGGVYVDASQTGRVYLARRGSSQVYDVENVSALFSNSTGISLRFTVPISGWKA